MVLMLLVMGTMITQERIDNSVAWKIGDLFYNRRGPRHSNRVGFGVVDLVTRVLDYPKWICHGGHWQVKPVTFFR